MREQPPIGLVNLLERLQLASAAQVCQVAPRVRRLAGELPDFESVWVDALQQARLLTPYQASEINAGRGDALLCGPYVVYRQVASPHYAECYSARHVESRRTVRLYRVRRPQVVAADAARQLERLVESLRPLRGPATCVPFDAGIIGDDVWAACSDVDGTTAADWMAENGRFPAHVVLHIAREMLVRLDELESLDAVHGDISARGLVVERSGRVVLPMPGLRGIVRPSEGYSFNDLPPAAYDYLAPERVADGDPPSVASDLYACGCLWWHLLAGRPPLSGGNSLAKLKAAHAGRILDIRQLCPEVPDVLALAMELCLASDPAERPQSSSQVLEVLGPTSRGGPAILARCLAKQAWAWQPEDRVRRAGKSRARRRNVAAAAVAAACLLVAGQWIWHSRDSEVPEKSVAQANTYSRDVASAEPDTLASSADAKSGEPQLQHADAAPHVDPAVRPASASESIDSIGVPDLVLDVAKPIRASDLRLKAGQRVRGQPGQRPMVVVSESPLRVAYDNVQFEGIDFVWHGDARNLGRPETKSTMILVAARGIEMRGCSFSTKGRGTPTAIRWRGSGSAAPQEDGELTFTDCVFRGVAAVVECRANAGITVALSNTLCIAAGPIVRTETGPGNGETIAISLDHTTTRGDCAVLDCVADAQASQPGLIVISVAESVLVTNPRGGLLVFRGEQRPDKLLRAIAWSGQGSLITAKTAVALWYPSGQSSQVLAEDDLAVAGLVRSDVEFAGPADGPPSMSRITRWQAPLQSIDPPGANVDVLYLPGE